MNIIKSTGVGNIAARFLKEGAIFFIPITFIINKPNKLKSARVKPLYKKKSQTEVGNYRPVSILCIVSNILEREVYNQLEHV